MIAVSFSEFLGNWKRNIFLALIISVMAVIVTSIYGILSYEKNKMQPFNQMEGARGYFIKYDYNQSSSDFIENPKAVYRAYNCELILNGETAVNVYAVDKWAYGYKPRMKKGSFIKAMSEDKAIPVVLGGSGSEKYKVGDILIVATTNSEKLSLRVSGILAEDEEILGAGKTYKTDECDYRMFYGRESSLFMLCAYDCIKESKAFMDSGYMEIVIVDDNMPDAEYEAIFDNIKRGTHGACRRLEKFVSDSKNVYREKLLAYIPLVITGILVVVICCYAAIYVNYMYGIKRFTIYYLLGMRPNQRLFLSLSNSIGTTFLSACITVFIYHEVKKKNVNLTINLDRNMCKMLALFYIIILISMSLMTFLSMRKKSPKEQLIKIAR